MVSDFMSWFLFEHEGVYALRFVIACLGVALYLYMMRPNAAVDPQSIEAPARACLSVLIAIVSVCTYVIARGVIRIGIGLARGEFSNLEITLGALYVSAMLWFVLWLTAKARHMGAFN